MVLTQNLIYEILPLWGEIPAGRVASYGQIARLIGLPACSRLVGRVLSGAELYGDYPCHRVVNHAGALAASFAAQRELLETEGVEFRGERVDIKKHRWEW